MTFLQSNTLTDTNDSKNEQKHTEKEPKVANDSKPSIINLTGIYIIHQATHMHRHTHSHTYTYVHTQ